MTRLNQGLSSLAPGGGKMRDPGNEVAAHASSVFLSSFNINLLAFYLECSSLIDFATIYFEKDSE